MNQSYVIGMDFGTDSVRTIVVDTADGKELASSVVYFSRWAEGKYCDPAKNQFRQHPADHMESLQESVNNVLDQVGKNARNKVIGIGVDTTGSTPAPVDREGKVLALREEFKDNPNAMFDLWKDHTAVAEAEEINRTAKTWGGVDFTKYSGGVYSSEWFWSKILHVLREDPQVKQAAYSWVEHADWIPALLTGNLAPLSLKRSRCAAGHKAMWHAEWGGLPSQDFLVRLGPLLEGLRERLYTESFTSEVKAGGLCRSWAEKFGLAEGIPVAVGAFDAHMGAVGTEIKEGTFVMLLGTSACEMTVASPGRLEGRLVEGICGQVDGSIIPGMIGLEAGQSSFGDVYAWFRDVLCWPVEVLLKEWSSVGQGEAEGLVNEIKKNTIPRLSEQASRLKTDETVPVSLDWLNGRRTPFADQKLKGAVIGLSLGTTAPKIFKSLVEATAFGARANVERFREEGIEIKDAAASGGIPKKSPFVMQVLSDVLDMPVKVARADQAGALGAGMFAAVAAGVYPDVEAAQREMGNGFEVTYYPDKNNSRVYDELYQSYKHIGTTLEDQLRK
ncbi:MAG: ribulokinase [Spirochaetota bacterium]